MQAVILAAGMGTRMKELTKDTPKPLLRIGDRTLLEDKLHHLPDRVDEVILVVGYLGDKIRETFGDAHGGRKITYVEQAELKGTGHALSLCRDHLHDRFLVLMGDDLYLKGDLEELADLPAAILAWELPEDMPDKKMADLIMDDQGRLIEIREGQPALKGKLINTGAYVLDRDFFDYRLQPAAPGSPEMGLPQTMVEMIKAGKEIFIRKATWWKNVTSPEDLKVPSVR